MPRLGRSPGWPGYHLDVDFRNLSLDQADFKPRIRRVHRAQPGRDRGELLEVDVHDELGLPLGAARGDCWDDGEVIVDGPQREREGLLRIVW